MKCIGLMFIVLGALFLQLSIWYFLGIPEESVENAWTRVRYQLYVFAVTVHILGGGAYLYCAWIFWKKR